MCEQGGYLGRIFAIARDMTKDVIVIGGIVSEGREVLSESQIEAFEIALDPPMTESEVMVCLDMVVIYVSQSQVISGLFIVELNYVFQVDTGDCLLICVA